MNWPKSVTNRFLPAIVVGAIGMACGVAWVAGANAPRAQAAPPDKWVSIVDAYNTAKSEAQTWDSTARLYQINSVDTSDANPNHGSDGSRARWNVEFVVPNTERHLNVVVDRGQVADVVEFRNPTLWDGFTDISTIRTGEVLRVAKQKGLQPSRNLGLGYHFRLHYYNGQPTISVLGELPDGERARLMLDPATMDLREEN